MIGLGTDLVAVACILGGAAVGGAATMAVVEGHRGYDQTACVRAAVDVHPRVVISLDGGRSTVVMTPRVWVHPNHDCVVWSGDAVRSFHVKMHSMRARMERERVRAERLHVRIRRVETYGPGKAVPALEKGISGATAPAPQADQQIRVQVKPQNANAAKLDVGTGG